MKFSLVIPLAPGRNAEIIDSIKELNYPKKEYEVIVREGLNPSENRNSGAEVAKGDIIVFLDDDATLDINYLKEAEEFFRKYKEIDIVGGAQLTPKWQRGFGKISGYALSSKFGAWKMGTRYAQDKLKLDADETMLTSANLLCKKGVMKKIQFDPNLFPGEDPKFIEDAKDNGLKVAYCPDLILYHKRRETIKALIKQIASYGRTRTKKEKFADTLKRPFFLIPLLFCVYLFATLILLVLELLKINLIPNVILFFPLGLYLLLDFIFSIYESIKNKNLFAIFLLIFIFPIIHLSYGFGMIKGYINKI